MVKKKDMSEVAREVITEYRKQGSLKAVASTLRISEGKVRKILITEKLSNTNGQSKRSYC